MNIITQAFNIIILGESGTGKTCFLRRYVDGTFLKSFGSTIGMDFKRKEITLDSMPITLKIFDTAGQERFRSISKQYYNKCDGIILAFDVSNQCSFDRLQSWVYEILENINTYAIGLVLIGTKADLENREISNETANIFAKKNDMRYFETSARRGDNIEESIYYLVRNIIEKRTMAIPPSKRRQGKAVSMEKKRIRHKRKDCC